MHPCFIIDIFQYYSRGPFDTGFFCLAEGPPKIDYGNIQIFDQLDRCKMS